VFPIRLPPLRDRGPDIIPLADALLARLSGAAGRSPPRLAGDARERLLREKWPGNVRELRNVLERALILAEGPEVRAEHLWIDAAPESTDAPPSSASEGGSLSDLERRAIEKALVASSGNRKAAAQQLGIGLRTLYEKLKRYGIR
jgi:DNA-binding NtrC family response regulator